MHVGGAPRASVRDAAALRVAGPDAVYKLAALTIGARLAVADG
jgi:hypothetical protein